MAYATEAELRDMMDKVGVTGSGSDENLAMILEGVSNLIDRFFNRPEGWFQAGTATTRLYPGSGLGYQLIDECIEVTLVETKASASDTTYESWAGADWEAFTGDPKFPNYNDLPYTGLMAAAGGTYTVFSDGYTSGRSGFREVMDVGRKVPTVRVTARWGYAAQAPGLIKQATLALGARWFKQGQGAWTDTLASADFGGMIYRAQNADIKTMLESSRFWRPAMG